MVWKMASTCLFWCLWRERNNRSFKEVEKTSEEILSYFFFFFFITVCILGLQLLFSPYLLVF